MILNFSRTTLVSSGIALAAIPALLLYSRRKMPSFRAIQSENASLVPSNYLPVAVFVGGTSGIGQGMAQALAKHTKGNAHIIIIGRNKESADKIISSFPKPTSQDAKHEFVQCDVTLMSNVHTTTSSLLSRLPKVNYLVMSPGVMNMNPRDETSEGIDKKLACHYYARFAFTYDLLPLLKKADEKGEDARVYSVFAAGQGGKVDLDDLGLKKAFTPSKAASQGVTYNDLMMEEFAESNKSTITFSHSYPGPVKTNLVKTSDSKLLRAAGSVLIPLLSPVFLSIEQSGEYQLNGLLKHKGGFKRIGPHGEDIGKTRFFPGEKERKELWKHSLKECRIEETE